MYKRRISFLLGLLAFMAVLYFYGLRLNSHKPKNGFSTGLLARGPSVWMLDKNKSVQSRYITSHMRYNRSAVPKLAYGRHVLFWWNEPPWMKNAKWNTNCDLSLCEYPNCEVTSQKAWLDSSSVVIIALFDKGTLSLPRGNRRLSQPWVFYTLECPDTYRRYVANPLRREFNWSMSYHRDADIFTPYGRLEERPHPNKDYSAIFRNKTKQVAWIVSHCHTTAKRERYARKLGKYLQVDIFGGCGRGIDDKSLQTTLSKYKFYLGFENALCRDYITEKYFHYLQYDLIVIVRGLANYNEILPNRTFINTADFDSIESLGNYLKRLSEDENEYVQYLKEKDKYFVYEREHLYCDGMCALCEKVNHLQENQKVYDNASDWVGERMTPSDLP